MQVKVNKLEAQKSIENIKNALTIEDKYNQLQVLIKNILPLDNYVSRLDRVIEYHKSWKQLCFEKNDEIYDLNKTKKGLLNFNTIVLDFLNDIVENILSKNLKCIDKKLYNLIKRSQEEIKKKLNEDEIEQYSYLKKDLKKLQYGK